MDEKSELRRELTNRRAEALARRHDAGAALAVQFPATIPIDDQTIVGGYMPFRTEIDPLVLMRALRARGAHVAMPKTNSPSPLRGGVGVGGIAASLLLENCADGSTPHPLTPSPPKGGRGGASLSRVAKRLRQEPTKYEKRLWDLLRAKRPGKTHWRRQVVVGGFVYDFGCHGLRLLLEVDGGVHKLPEVQARDRLKMQAANEHGYRLIRLQNEEVLTIETAQFFDRFAQSNSPSPLWGGVGVGGIAASPPLENCADGSTHHPPTPSPPKGGRGEVLTFHLCDLNNQTHFQTNSWGIPEPRDELPTATPTILLVPLLGFDSQGNRIGYGKGFYDRAIQKLKPNIITIGLAFAEQEVDYIPTQPHDQRLDWIVTPNEAYRFSS